MHRLISHHRFGRILAACCLVTLACLPSVAQDEGGSQQDRARAVRDQLGEIPEDVDIELATRLSQTFRAAAQRALPSVVYIEVQKQASEQRLRQIPEPFRRFFGDPDEQPQPQIGAGSGFFYDDEGRIITNAHVVRGATELRVRLLDGREFDGEVVGTDSFTDIAVIDVDPDGDVLPAELGSSENVQIGDWVLALGSPLGLDFTVTAGIVSARGRNLPTGDQEALQAFIQTDAAINPGNSGGPLVNLEGDVIGINTAIAGAARFVGYGLAVPIDLAKHVVSDLIEYGHVRRPRLGVSVSDVTAVDAEAYGLEEIRGADVNSVESGSAADRAGLEIGDVVIAVDGEPIDNATDLTTGLAQYEPGDVVELTIIRDGERRSIEVELGQFETDEAGGETEAEPHDMTARLGLAVEALTPQLAQRLGYETGEGVVVSRVDPVGPAARAGIRPGVMITAINRQGVNTPADVAEVVATIEPGAVVSMRIRTPDTGETLVNFRTRD